MAKKKAENEPNVMFIGGNHDTSAKDLKPGDDGFVPREPIKGFRDGKQYTLPPVEEQVSKDGFYFEHSGILTRLFPQLYKPIVIKGAK